VRVVVPYVPGMLHPRVVPALQREGYRPELIECTGPGDYPAALAAYLICGEDVLIVEHDVEVRPGFIASLDGCPCPWGFFAYDLKARYEESCWGPDGAWGTIPDWFAPLGCTRFRAGVGTAILPEITSADFLSHWLSRDVIITGALRKRGLRPHRHPGKAVHWHRY
jgi:hypothetical protein